MKGSVHYDKNSRRYYVSIYWQSKRYKIFKHPVTLEPFWHEKSALKQLSRIQTEVDDGSFNPRHWFPDSPLSMRIYCIDWLNVIDVMNKTIKNYKGFVKNYINPYFGDMDIRSIRYKDLLKFKKWIEAKGRQPKTVYNVVACLKTIMRFAWYNEDIKSVPPFPRMAYKHPEIKYLTLDQQEAVLTEIQVKDRPIFQFMMEYGCRVGEARAIMKDCIDGNTISIRRRFSENELVQSTKGDDIRKDATTGRIYEITPYIRDILKAMPKHLSPFLFVTQNGKPYTSAALNRIWKAACKTNNIEIPLKNATRHSLGCQLLDMGCDLDLVRQQLGHTKSEMTRRYAKRSKSVLTTALKNRRGKITPLKAPNSDSQ